MDSTGPVSGFACTYAKGGLQVDHKDLAVTDLAGAGRAGDGGDGVVDPLVRQGDFDLQLGQEGNGVFGAAIDFRMPFLAAIAAHFRHGQAGNADLGQGEAHIVEAMRLDDGGNEFHGPVSSRKRVNG